MYSASRCYYYTIAILVYCILNHPTGYVLPVDLMLCSIFRPASDPKICPWRKRFEMRCNATSYMHEERGDGLSLVLVPFLPA